MTGKKLGNRATPKAKTGGKSLALSPQKSRPAPDHGVRVIGVGASAGGIEAFRRLLAELREPLGAALVFITHLSSNHKSHLQQVLKTATSMPILEVTGQLELRADCVYVNEAQSDLVLEFGRIIAIPRTEAGARHHPIDLFFESLAAEQKSRAVGVLLSGMGSDGTHGLNAIQALHGSGLVQDPDTAEYGAMPRSAVDAGFVDKFLPIDELAAELYVLLGAAPQLEAEATSERSDQADLRDILSLLRDQTGTDFAQYKANTVRRRLTRCMAAANMTSLGDYQAHLRRQPEAVQSLFEEILIHVTAFFRDPLAFASLKENVFPRLLDNRPADRPVRIWVPGCSTGKEAYSLAIAYHEYASQVGHGAPLQLFATDLSESVIATARAGRYGKDVENEVSQERLERFFIKVESGYQINESIRSSCLFVRHHLTADPPFSRIDLISCRNLLIYFEPNTQREALTMFQYCLNKPGFLLLGRSESISALSGLFEDVDKFNKIFAASGAVNRLRLGAKMTPFGYRQRAPLPANGPAINHNDLDQRLDAAVLARANPPGILVNNKLDILHFRGNTGNYVSPVPGRPDFSVARMARTDLAPAIRLLVQCAKDTHLAARQDNVPFNRDGVQYRVDLEVLPVPRAPDSAEEIFLVLFLERPAQAVDAPKTLQEPAQERIIQLERELAASHDYIRVLAGDHQQVNDDLSLVNEELVTSNEELQSLNEELETAKEELQSGNEELTTLNDELQSRNTALNQANTDLVNLLNAIEIPIIITDRHRRIRRFTPESCRFISLIETDSGRCIDDLRVNFECPDFVQKIKHVISDGEIIELEIETPEAQWHRMQMRPYRSITGQIDGVVLSFVDITSLKNYVAQAERARDWASELAESIPLPLVFLSSDLTVNRVNLAFTQLLSIAPAAIVGQSLSTLAGNPWNYSIVQYLLGQAQKTAQQTFYAEMMAEIPPGNTRRLWLVARSIHYRPGEIVIMLGVQDITERHEREQQEIALHRERQSRLIAEDANRAKDEFLAMLSHELRTPLAVVKLRAQLLIRHLSNSHEVERDVMIIQGAVRMQERLVEDLLDVSKIVSGKMQINREPVDWAEAALASAESQMAAAEAKGVQFVSQIEMDLAWVRGDTARLQQIVDNLLSNAIKFTPRDGTCKVCLAVVGGQAVLTVKDDGEGIAPEALAHIFDRFAQADASSTRRHGGLGLGLAIVRHLVELHGGRVQGFSKGPGCGALFKVFLPLVERPKKVARKPSAVSTPAGLEALANVGGLDALVIDDELELRQALAEALRMMGMRVTSVGSALEGLELLQTSVPKVILCDINMPGHDGFSFIEQLQSGSLGSVPVIAITARASTQDEHALLEAGFAAHLAKPFTIEHLREVVCRVLKIDSGQAPSRPSIQGNP